MKLSKRKYYMKLILISAFLSLIQWAPLKEKSVLLRHINIVNIEDGTILRNQFIQLKNGKIWDIGNDNNKPGGLDFTNKYVIPGLCDMHMHLHNRLDSLQNYLKMGGTSVRDMGVFTGEVDSLPITVKEIKRHKEKYPDYIFAGPILNGLACEVNEHKTITDSTSLLKAVKEIKHSGSAFIKIHNCFPVNLFDYLMQLSKKYHLPVSGHIPEGLSPLEASAKGMASIEHTGIIFRAFLFQKNNPAKDISEAIQLLTNGDSLFQCFAKNKTAVVTSLVTEKAFAEGLPEALQKLQNAVIKKLHIAVKKLYDNGVLLMAGTDYGLPGLVAGKSIHDELNILVDAGLTNLQALQCATINPSVFLKVENQVGTIAKNKRANIVILDGNPLENIKNIYLINSVFKDGYLVK